MVVNRIYSIDIKLMVRWRSGKKHRALLNICGGLCYAKWNKRK